MGLYTVLLGTTFVSYSIGYIVSIVAPSSLAQLVGVVVVFCMSAFDGASPTLPNLHNSPPPLNWGFEHLSFLTPALKAFYDNEAEMWINTTKAAQIDMVDFAKKNFGYDQGQYWISILILFSWGIFFRLVTHTGGFMSLTWQTSFLLLFANRAAALISAALLLFLESFPEEALLERIETTFSN